MQGSIKRADVQDPKAMQGMHVRNALEAHIVSDHIKWEHYVAEFDTASDPIRRIISMKRLYIVDQTNNVFCGNTNSSKTRHSTSIEGALCDWISM